MILDGHGQAVRNRLVHGVPVDLAAKRLIGFRNGRAREPHKGGLGKSLLQDLCIRFGDHGFHILIRVLAEPDLLACSSCVRCASSEKQMMFARSLIRPIFVIFPVAEFLDSADIEPAALTSAQFFLQRFAAWDNAHLAQIQKFFALVNSFAPCFCSSSRSTIITMVGADLRHIGAAQSQLPGKGKPWCRSCRNRWPRSRFRPLPLFSTTDFIMLCFRRRAAKNCGYRQTISRSLLSYSLS